MLAVLGDGKKKVLRQAVAVNAYIAIFSLKLKAGGEPVVQLRDSFGLQGSMKSYFQHSQVIDRQACKQYPLPIAIDSIVM